MAFSDRRLARTHPETDSGVPSSQLRSCISKVQLDQPFTKNHIREIPEPYPNRTRNSGCCENSVSRVARSDAILDRHGSRDAEAETGPEAVNLAVWGGESGRGPARGGGGPGMGGRFPGAQHFLRKRSLAEHPLDGRKRHIADIQIRYSRGRKRPLAVICVSAQHLNF
jgi:hypothetical protein